MTLSSYLTTQPAEVIKEWAGDNVSIEKKACFTGMMISASEIFSVSDGIVIAVENNDEFNCQVTVQYSNNIYFRYLNVSNVPLKITQVVKQCDKIGDCIKNRGVIEYITATQSNWPVAINGNKLFKNNPLSAISMQEFLVFNKRIEDVTDTAFNNIEINLSEAMNEEFSNNRGDY